jgi:hypothetical protein
MNLTGRSPTELYGEEVSGKLVVAGRDHVGSLSACRTPLRCASVRDSFTDTLARIAEHIDGLLL